jgi:hypothetical protein
MSYFMKLAHRDANEQPVYLTRIFLFQVTFQISIGLKFLRRLHAKDVMDEIDT